MLRKIIAMGMAVGSIQQVDAQDSTEKNSLKITGNADVYYRYDFASHASNNLTSFTNSHNDFELGMATVKFNYKTSKTEVVADLGFGKRAREFSYNDDGIVQAVKQLYVSYSPEAWLKFTAGSWATHIGYEVVDANLNRNYSMSYMFTNGPFFHTGVKAEASFGKSGFMAGIANPTDFKYVPQGVMNRKAFIAQYSYSAGDIFKLYLNYVGGQGIDTTKSRQFDVVATSSFSSKFSLAYNGTLARMGQYTGGGKFDENKSWWGSALYLNFDPVKNLGFTVREEYFSDKNGLKVYSAQPAGGSVLATTLSANIKLDHLTIIPELRMDHASHSIFSKKDYSPTMNSASALIAAVYSF